MTLGLSNLPISFDMFRKVFGATCIGDGWLGAGHFAKPGASRGDGVSDMGQSDTMKIMKLHHSTAPWHFRRHRCIKQETLKHWKLVKVERKRWTW